MPTNGENPTSQVSKRFKGAPFGFQSDRFNVKGLHPQLMPPGTLTQIAYCNDSKSELLARMGPGTYDIKDSSFSDKAMQAITKRPGWAREDELLKLKDMPNLAQRSILKKKKDAEKNLGPGTYNTEKNDFIRALSTKPSCKRGAIEIREKRFREVVKNEVPGPGTYGRGGIPQAAIEEKERQSTSTIGLLHSKAAGHKPLPTVGCNLGPGNYQLKSYLDTLLSKTVSVRGPYDVYTGERHKPITVGHMTTPPQPKLPPGHYKTSSFLDKMKDTDHRHHGQFSKLPRNPKVPCERMFYESLTQCPKDPDDPGPGHYEVRSSSAPFIKRPNKNGFNVTSARFNRVSHRSFTGNANSVGVGRYDIDRFPVDPSGSHSVSRNLNGHYSAFKSKSVRLSYSAENALRERLKGTKQRILVETTN
ncbi:Lymphocyte expansion molecule [Trichoplax sp. H2]|nr:Lymphocyte expansion molecule [Trichoplax sp. H2]|eukprot:RDD40236.1 Lymphocyte expansion molecule [Trichoplax sp. H2]